MLLFDAALLTKRAEVWKPAQFLVFFFLNMSMVPVVSISVEAKQNPPTNRSSQTVTDTKEIANRQFLC